MRRSLAVDGAPDPIFERGERIGELARTHVPGGRLIDRPRHEIRQRAEATRQALADHAPAIYEASFLEDDIFVSVDILERRSADRADLTDRLREVGELCGIPVLDHVVVAATGHVSLAERGWR